MVSTIAAVLFLSAIILVFWAIASTLHAHAGQIAHLMGAEKQKYPLPAARRSHGDPRRPVSITPLRAASLCVAA